MRAWPVCLILLLAIAVLSAAACSGGRKGAGVDSSPGPVAVTLRTPQPPPADTRAGGAAATIPEDNIRAQIDAILSQYSPDRQFAHLQTLSSDSYQGRRAGTAGAEAAADYISTQFSGLGLAPWSALGLGSYSQPFTAAGLDSANIIGVLPGSNPNGPFIILAAHYDHLGVDANGAVFNGADDNAAGVAALLETARIFQNLNLKTSKTVVFCAFSGEEQGQLGAAALGQLITNAGLAGSVEMINIDGIGATGGSYFGVWDEGNPDAAPLVAALLESGRYLGIPVREEGTDIGSDAQTFDWQFGIPAVTVDWNWGNDTYAFHPYYHTIYDDPENIDRPVLANATKVAIVGLWIGAR